MKATLKLINSYFWKSLYGPVFAVIFPPLLLIILGSVMRVEYVLPGVIACSVLFIGVLVVPLSIMEIKRSTLSKNIGVSPIGVKTFTAVIALFYSLVSLFSILVSLLLGTFVFWNDVVHGGLYSGLFSLTGFFSFLFGGLLHILFCLMFGLLVATFTKTAQQVLTASIIIILPSMFLSGMIISVDIIASSDIMQWISRLVPFRYSTGNLVVAFSQSARFSGELLAGSDGKVNPILQALFIDPDGKYKESFDIVKQSTNNMFDWTHDWGVKKIADPSQIRALIQDYIAVGKTLNFAGISDIILGDDFSKNTIMSLVSLPNVLYTSTERILNTVLPVVLIAGSAVIITYKFKWTTR